MHIVNGMKREHTPAAPVRAFAPGGSAPRGSFSPAARLARERIAAALGPAAAALAALPDPLAAIDGAVAAHYGVAPAALVSRRRDGVLRRARRAAWALGWAGARRPLDALCRRYGRRPGRIAAAVEALAGEAGGAALHGLRGLAAAACAGARPAPRPGAPRRAARARRRPCLCCGAPFRSEGPHNRLCDPCREEHAGEPDDAALGAAGFAAASGVEPFIVEAPL